ncbi:MAG: hypothetical protein AB9917_14875 [Negativicutes bacterium]
MEILSGAGGGVLALFHHLFSVALVILVADLAVSALPHSFFWRRQNRVKIC